MAEIIKVELLVQEYISADYKPEHTNNRKNSSGLNNPRKVVMSVLDILTFVVFV